MILTEQDKVAFLGKIFPDYLTDTNYANSQIHFLQLQTLFAVDEDCLVSIKKLEEFNSQQVLGPKKYWASDFVDFFCLYLVTFKNIPTEVIAKKLQITQDDLFAKFGQLIPFAFAGISDLNNVEFENVVKWDSLPLPMRLSMPEYFYSLFLSQPYIFHEVNYNKKSFNLFSKDNLFSLFNRKEGLSLKRFSFEVVFFFVLTIIFMFILKKLNYFYEKNLTDQISLTGLATMSLDKSLAFKNWENTPRKKIKLSSNQLEELEKSEKLATGNIATEDFLPETDMLDTSILVAGWNEKGLDYQDGEVTDAQLSGDNDYRDKYYGYAKSYRLMMNSSDLFDVRLKIMNLNRRYKVSDGGSPITGKESLEGIYFNLHVPSTQISNFLADIGNLEQTNVYINKTSRPPPPGKERVFIWVKRI